MRTMQATETIGRQMQKAKGAVRAGSRPETCTLFSGNRLTTAPSDVCHAAEPAEECMAHLKGSPYKALSGVCHFKGEVPFIKSSVQIRFLCEIPSYFCAFFC